MHPASSMEKGKTYLWFGFSPSGTRSIPKFPCICAYVPKVSATIPTVGRSVNILSEEYYQPSAQPTVQMLKELAFLVGKFHPVSYRESVGKNDSTLVLLVLE